MSAYSVEYSDQPPPADTPIEPPVEDGRSFEQPVNPADYAPPAPRRADPGPPNELEIANADRLDAIYINANLQRQVDDAPDIEDLPPPPPPPPEMHTEMRMEMPPPPPQAYRIKVDGFEQDVPLADLVRNYQLNQAADRRLNEASMLRAQAQKFLEAAATRQAQPTNGDQRGAQAGSQPPTSPAQSPTEQAGFSEKELIEAAEQLQLGTTEQGANALKKLLEKTHPAAPPPPMAPPVDIRSEVHHALREDSDQRRSTDAVAQFFNYFPTLADDEVAHGALVAASRLEMMRDFAAKGVPVDALRQVSPEILTETHRRARLSGIPGIRQPNEILQAVAQQPRFQPFAYGFGNAPLQVDVDRGWRKEMVQPQPALRSAPPPQPPQFRPMSPEERNAQRVAEMRAERGLAPV